MKGKGREEREKETDLGIHGRRHEDEAQSGAHRQHSLKHRHHEVSV